MFVVVMELEREESSHRKDKEGQVHTNHIGQPNGFQCQSTAHPCQDGV